MSTDTTPRAPLELTIKAELDGWPVDMHLSLPAEKVRPALERLAQLGYRPRHEQPPSPAPRAEGAAGIASPPTCPVHGTAKVRQGQRGGHFCAAKLADGSYCRERPI